MQTDKNMTGSGTSSATSGRPGLSETARDAARHEMDDARDRLHGAADRARHEARHARSSVSRLVMEEVDRRKSDLCDGIHGIAESMRKAAEEADRREDTPQSPRMVHQAINTLDDFADRMRHRSAEDMTQSVARFGRENPALFVGGALFAGLAIGRFLVSSSSDRRRRGDWDEGDRMGADAWRDTAYGSSAHERASHEPLGAKSHDLPSGTGVGGTAAAKGNPSGAASYSSPSGAAMPGSRPATPGSTNEAEARSGSAYPTGTAAGTAGLGATKPAGASGTEAKDGSS
ncbi:hypothetical protein [Rhodobacter sp. NSM]|uniref:hypothetical protein n=1 Tax=Rhodobacter sp. NSM TaxID=3457501 RepID=UPI003FD26324